MADAAAVDAFAAEIGDRAPVAVVGARTQWDVGGLPAGAVRVVGAPAGVVEHRPAEMTVRVLAGTSFADLDAALDRAGQMVPLDPVDARATVGGLLSVGRTGVRRLRYGPVRDFVLELRYVSSAGAVVRAGAPVVKNVSGFDLVRVLVGSLGTLGCLAEAVLRTVPRPETGRWLRGPVAGAVEAGRTLYRASAVLTDGRHGWALLEGHPSDVAVQAASLPRGWEESGPPDVPAAGRLSVDPAGLEARLRQFPPGSYLAELGVGVVHLGPDAVAADLVGGGARPRPEPGVEAIGRRLKEAFDPTGRLNPGRMP